MTGVSMPFLQRLVARAGATGRVRPALAPRFASGVVPPSDATGIAAPFLRAQRAERAVDEAAHASEAMPARDGSPHAPTVPHRDGPREAGGIRSNTSIQRHVEADLRSEVRHTPDWPKTASFAASVDAQAARPPQSANAHDAARAAVQAVVRPDERRPQRDRAAPPPHIAPAPLRQSVIDQRMPAPVQQQQPTVVHVTIDRIDVRAPATAPPPQRPAAKPRADTSAIPLADYLRKSDPSRRGGAP